MTRAIKYVHVAVRVSVGYNPWTQFEEFPKLIEGATEGPAAYDQSLHRRAPNARS
jgi:hypothetical protein